MGVQARRGGGGARRPPLRRVSAARIAARARVSRAAPPAVRRPEGIRWLRSDGTPNWSQRVAERQGELELVASRPPIGVSTSSVILEALEVMSEHKVRGLVVTDGKGRLAGLLTAMDLVNYLGGGEYYSIVKNRYNDNIYHALREEKVTTIMNPTPLFLYKTNSLLDALNLMVTQGVGIIPVLYEDGTVYGIVTEHDIVVRLRGKKVGKKVSDVMSTNIVVVGLDDPIKRAAETMVRHGFRRLPTVNERNEIKGVITAKDYVIFFGSHRAFNYVVSPSLEELITKVKVYELAELEFHTIREDADVGEAADAMAEYNVNSLIVVNEEGDAVGIVTERDVLIALAIEG